MKKFLKTLILIGGTWLFAGSFFHSLSGGIIASSSAVFAQTSATTTTAVSSVSSATETFASVLQLFLRGIYIIIWPLLWIAGYAMDNTFVYGSFFQLDAPLWKMRNLMKNFANFFLGFFMLYQILKFVFWQNKESDVKKVITDTLIAGVAIQASWFFLAALIDLSTLATYAIGGLPISVLDNTKVGNRPLLSEDAQFSMSDLTISSTGKTDFKVEKRYGKENKKIARCLISGGNIGGVVDKDGNEILFGGSYKEFATDKEKTYHTNLCYIGNNDVIVLSKDTKEPIAYLTTQDQIREKLKGRDQLLKIEGGLKLSDIIKATQSYVGPLVTLYSSLLDFSSMNVVPLNDDYTGLTLQFVIKAIATLALIIPLILMAVVLIIRIGALWLIIAFSPLIALKWVYGKNLPDFGQDKKLEPSYILSIIFAPVMAVFALSLSIVFMSVIQESMLVTDSAGTPNFEKQFGIKLNVIDSNALCLTTDVTKNEFCMKLKSKEIGGGMYLNYFYWAIINMIAIGIVWMLFFAVMNSIELTKGFTTSVQGLGESFVSRAPIIPVPGIGGLSYSSLSSTPEKMKNQYDAKSRNADDLVSNLALYNIGSQSLSDGDRVNYLEARIGENGSYVGGDEQLYKDIEYLWKKKFTDMKDENERSKVLSLLSQAGLKNFEGYENSQLKGFGNTLEEMEKQNKSLKEIQEFIKGNQLLANTWFNQNPKPTKLTLNIGEANNKTTYKVQLDEKKNLVLIAS